MHSHGTWLISYCLHFRVAQSSILHMYTTKIINNFKNFDIKKVPMPFLQWKDSRKIIHVWQLHSLIEVCLTNCWRSNTSGSEKPCTEMFLSLSPQTPCEIETTVSSHLALPEGGDLLLSGTVIILPNQLVFNKFGS